MNLFSLNLDEMVLSNSDFENWTLGNPDGWTVDSGTATKDLVNYYTGISSLSLSAGEVHQLVLNPEQFSNRKIAFSCQVRTSSASKVRLALIDDAGTIYSSDHSGNGGWETLIIYRDCGTLTSLQAKLIVDTGAIANFDVANLTSWILDEEDLDLRLDSGEVNQVEIVFESNHNSSDFLYNAHDLIDIDFKFEDDYILSYSDFIDLLPLVPEKFRSSILLQTFLYQTGLIAGTWIQKTKDLKYLKDPYSVSKVHIQQLANLVDLELLNFEESSVDQLRKQLIQAIDWLKIKGTYRGLKLISFFNNVTVNIYDLYTSDYENFIRADWFVGSFPGENPPGIDSGYYKSPHFVYEVVLDTVYDFVSGESGNASLWNNSVSQNIFKLVEKTRPANTVPHLSLFLNAITIENHLVYSTAVYVKTTVTNNWQYINKYLDGDTIGSGEGFDLDNGVELDTSFDAFIDSITKYKLGIGRKGQSPDSSMTDLEDSVLTGNITSKTVYEDRAEFEIIVDASILKNGISEIGLFNDDLSAMEVVATFPDIDKPFGMELRILVQVYNLSI